MHLPRIKIMMGRSPRKFSLLEDVTLYGVTIPAGYTFDGASVPDAFLWLLPRMDGTVAAASVLHDWLYETKADLYGLPVNRAFADALFRVLLWQAGVPLWRRWLAWLAVRLFGWLYWSRRWEPDSLLGKIAIKLKGKPQ